MTDEELAELLAEQACYIHHSPPTQASKTIFNRVLDLYTVSLYDWNFQEFGTLEGATEFRKIMKRQVKEKILLTLLNKRISEKIQEEHKNHETTVATERQKTLMGK